MATFVGSASDAVADIADGSTVLIGGFGSAGQPVELIEAMVETRATDLTVVSNNAGNGDHGLALLIRAGRVRRMVCSFPRQSDSWHFDAAYRAGTIELELVPQGNLAERIRAGGAGLGGFFTPTGAGTQIAEGKESRVIEGREMIFEKPLKADYAIVRAWKGDKWGNLVFRKTARNFSPMMCTAARIAIAEVEHLVEVGELEPDQVHVPSVFVKRIFQGKSYEKPVEKRTVRAA
jgi:3-oxoadipate CoA-transferase, alpha subunit